METWQDTKDLLYGTVGDAEGTHAFFSATQTVNFANKALWEIAQATRSNDIIRTFNTVSGTALYTVTGSTYGQALIGVWRVEIDDEPLIPVTRKALARNTRNWREQSGKPTHYYLDAQGNDADQATVGFWPEPDAVYPVRVYGHMVPKALTDSDDGAYVNLPRWAAPAVLYSMIADAYRSRGKATDMEVSQFYRMLFEDVVERLRRRSNSRLNMDRSMGMRPSRRRMTVRDLIPDTIPEP